MSTDNPEAVEPDRPDEPTTLAERLNHLFALARAASPDGKEPSYRMVAAAIEAASGISTSPSYLHSLRTGAKDNPTKRHLETLATYFGVSPAYFFGTGPDDQVQAQLATLRTLRDSGVLPLALQTRGLSQESLDLLAQLVDHIRGLEGLDKEAGLGSGA